MRWARSSAVTSCTRTRRISHAMTPHHTQTVFRKAFHKKMRGTRLLASMGFVSRFGVTHSNDGGTFHKLHAVIGTGVLSIVRWWHDLCQQHCALAPSSQTWTDAKKLDGDQRSTWPTMLIHRHVFIDCLLTKVVISCAEQCNSSVMLTVSYLQTEEGPKHAP
jgi:hypothetical protein